MTQKEMYGPLDSLTFLDCFVLGLAFAAAFVIDFFMMLENRHATVYFVSAREEVWRDRHRR